MDEYVIQVVSFRMQRHDFVRSVRNPRDSNVALWYDRNAIVYLFTVRVRSSEIFRIHEILKQESHLDGNRTFGGEDAAQIIEQTSSCQTCSSSRTKIGFNFGKSSYCFGRYAKILAWYSKVSIPVFSNKLPILHT